MRKKITIILTIVALLSIGAADLDKVYAYFTTYARAAGSHDVALGDETEINEELVDGNKKVVIKNKDTSVQAVYVRARAFASSAIEESLNYSGSGWSKGSDDWYYYDEPLEPGKSASELLIEVTGRPADDTEIFKVTVVYESVPAIQNGEDADGNIVYEAADWNMKAGGDKQ